MGEPRLETLPGRFPAPLRDYAEKFNAREYMAAAHHEEMVVVWTRAQSHLYRGLMILAAAFVHLECGYPEGARIKFRKGPRPVVVPPAALPRRGRGPDRRAHRPGPDHIGGRRPWPA